MKAEHQSAVLRRLKNARGHLDGVIRMVEDDTYCPDVMKQLSAVQGAVQGANRLMLRNHLETCVAAAMQAGRTGEIVDELMEALRFDPGPPSVGLEPAPTVEEVSV
ncbi:MAG: metal-sensitive transcriptional regulator [Ilumatobacteraceae bacterium]|nr:metal-sensitive transcriptional regulator [Ilumatobacteraceae bacterium]